MSGTDLPEEKPRKHPLRAFVTQLSLALGMLSRLPTPAVCDVTEEDLKRSVAFYPAVGALLGAFVAVASFGLRPLHVPLLGGALLVGVLAALTGALHLDGVADLFDALGSGKGRERMLEIMKDSRIGAHGACALILVLIAKVALFDAALHRAAPLYFALVPAMARLAIVPLITLFPGAREGGLGQSVRGRLSPTVLGLCLIQAGLMLPLPGTGIALLSALGAAVLIGVLALRKLGGTTGDVYGAALECAELAAALALLLAG